MAGSTSGITPASLGRIAFGAVFALFASNFMTFWLPLVW
jgi:hypothetical protein